ncbi:MAG TPA: RHS repeat protein [Cyclobacteriaceae bacterium]|nr:RHS repeat protein [Cyclobacteriaceae bacterium]
MRVSVNGRGLLLLVSVLLINASDLVGQQPGYNLPKVEEIVKIPPSPEAQAFTKFGNTAVNLYTGTPEISIPIHTAKGREISVPITLSYDASGVRVEAIPTWVGMGWNLSVGGMVTRQVNGNPDDYTSAFPAYYPFYSPNVHNDYQFEKGFNPLTATSPQGQLKRHYDFMKRIVKEVASDKIETQPDTYSFNALGVSGTLVINYETNPISAWCIEHPEIKAVPTIVDTTAVPIKLIKGWAITDGNGNVYYFNKYEKTDSWDNTAAENFKKYYSSWMLTRVESKNKRDVIDFVYGPGLRWTQPQLAGRSDTRVDYPNLGMGNDVMNTAPAAIYQITQYELNSIVVNGFTEVQLIPSPTGRLDLIGKNALSAIRINDQTGTQIKYFKFIQSYTGVQPQGSTEDKYLRLQLDKVEIHGTGILTNPQTYQFQYAPGILPPRDSFSQDFWGFYNGNNSNTLIPYDYDLDANNLNPDGFTGADRRPNLSAAVTGTLSSIKYPTGGTTEFTYGLNQSTQTSFSYKNDVFRAGGVVTGSPQGNPLNTQRCEPDKEDFRMKQVGFTVSGSNPFRILLQSTGTTDANTTMHTRFVAIYRGSNADGSAFTASLCDIVTGLANPQFDPNLIFPVYQQNLPVSYSNTVTTTLLPGRYEIVIVNSDPNATIEVDVTETVSYSSKDVGGLRTTRILDKDEFGTVASNRYFVYDDLSTVPVDSLTESVLAGFARTSGSLHTTLQFEEAQTAQHADTGLQLDLITSGYFNRFGSNRIQAQYIITYPVVSEIQFDNAGTGAFLGFTVHEFYDQIDSHVSGFQKQAMRNGKPLATRTYNSLKQLLTKEQNYVSQQARHEIAGFYFIADMQWEKDLYVQATVANPAQEFVFYKDPVYTRSTSTNSWTGTHCVDTGIACFLFDDTGYHSAAWLVNHTNSHQGIDCDAENAIMFNSGHQAMVAFNDLLQQGVQGVTKHHGNTTGLVEVCRPVYTIIACYDLGAKYSKHQYSYIQWWVKTDSTVTTTYNPAGVMQSVARSFYDDTTHFQVTRMESRDSKGVLHKARLYYAHEMLAANQNSSAMTALLAANRIAEPIKTEATYGVNPADNFPDFVQVTAYKSITAGTQSMVVPDFVQMSSGTGPLETRIRYNQYDAVGNPVDVNKEGDSHLAYLWGYSKLYPIAQVKNALSSEIFHTSFEAGEEGANSTLGDGRTGMYSKTNGYSKTLTGLTPNKAYTLTYWQKSSGIWSLQTVSVPASASTSYTISLTGQVDEIRFYPQGSFMTTYTYLVPAGETSVTDPNNQSTFYEYDNLGRLVVVRDNFGNILKTIAYNYKQ